ncbi:MAG TPA: hypothetical protein PKV15_04910 [Syntrophomonadaceae bacterium]|nr:hypothetical protein [Syntrophomonadaceae bacterium]HRX20842.1 hypothetical protein [Syntrophomonadaceae bacterium]
MLILLKLLCFTVWLVIMLYLVGGSNNSFQNYSEVKIRINEIDNPEVNIARALSRLKKNDRLIIEAGCDFLHCRHNQVLLRSILKKNPSLGYSFTSEKLSC